jgi:hypothetical protein
MSSKREVRAFGDVATGSKGKLQQDEPKGSEAARQVEETGEDVSYGEMSSGRTFEGTLILMSKDFQGRSGQPDNQDIHRPKGST